MMIPQESKHAFDVRTLWWWSHRSWNM